MRRLAANRRKRGRVPQPSGHGVEAFVRVAVGLFSGLGALLTGAFIRSCAPGLPAAFRDAWCGVAPPPGFGEVHHHCAGCVLILAGATLILISPFLDGLPALRASRGRTP
jgi:hypothetical protein